MASQNRKIEVINKCLFCNNDFTTTQYLLSIKKGIFCGKLCFNSFKKGKVCFGKAPIQISTCLKCNIDFKPKTKMFGVKTKYCSSTCFNTSQIGRTAWNKGISPSVEVREKIRINTPVRYGEQHPRWIKDRNLVEYFDKRNSTEYQTWNKDVRIRDGNKCKIGNKECKGRLEVHHILNWKEYPELRYEVNNGIVLCVKHHPHKRQDEYRLSPYFKHLINQNL